ncbi:MAG: radical SAM protein [Nitrospinae bacterium]|nr:radical SAM protein [Nitrospinota bacterium]
MDTKSGPEPQIFAAPRFMFPYSLVWRPFPLESFVEKPGLAGAATLGVCRGIVFRQEFFGSIAYRQYSATEFPYGHITYLDKGACELIARMERGTTIDKLRVWAAALGYSESVLERFVQKGLHLGIFTLGPSNSEQPPRWDIAMWESGETRLSAPLRLYLNITERCNMACSHCYASAGKGTRQLNRETLENLFDQAVALKIPTIVLIGGEPLMFPDFPGLVAGAVRRGLSVFTNTNGLGLNSARAEQLKTAGLPIISISLDGPDAATHDSMRGKGRFEKTVKGIRNSFKAGLPVGMSATLTEKTFNVAGRFVDCGLQLGIKDFHFMVMSPVGRGQNAGDLLIRQESGFKTVREALWAKQNEYPDITINCTSGIHPVFIKEWRKKFEWNDAARYVYSGCEAGRFRMDVSFDGSYIPCVLLNHPSFKVGMAGVDDLGEVWRNSAVMRDFAHRAQPCEDEECAGCEAVETCKGGCRGVIFAHYGVIGRKDPTCGGVMACHS